MKKFTIFTLLFFSLITIGCNGSYHNINGSGNTISKTFDVSEFTNIDASHAFKIDVVVGSIQSVRIETDNNLMEYIEVYVKNNTLYLDHKNSVNLDGEVKAIISVESLKGIDLSGACKIDIKNYIMY